MLELDNESDKKELIDFEIPQIDLVIVDLYPFEDTISSGASHSDIIEKIDIGGISLIRAAAKNYKDVVCVSLTLSFLISGLAKCTNLFFSIFNIF